MDVVPLFLLSHVAGYHAAYRYPVADDFATTFQAMVYQVRVVLGGHGVHGHRCFDSVLLQCVQHAENTNSVSVLPVGGAGEVRIPPGAHAAGQKGGETSLRFSPFHVLQVHDDAEGDPGAVRPTQLSPVDDGRPLVMWVIHAGTAFCRHS